MQANFNIGLLRRVVDIHHRRLQQIAEIDGLHIGELFQRVEAGEGEQLLYQSGGAVDSRVQLIQRFALAFRIVLRHLRHLRLYPQRGQRATQFMGGIRGEAALAGHHVVGAAEKLIQGIEQRPDLTWHAVGIDRVSGIRIALA